MRGPDLIAPADPSLGAALTRAARGEDGLTFVVGEGRETFLSYRKLAERASRHAAGLTASGIRRGDRVALILPTSPEFPEAFFGVLLAGAVPVPLYPPLRLGRLPEYHAATAGMLAAVEARLFITDRRIRRLLGQIVARVRPGLGCLTLEELAGGDGAVPDAVLGVTGEIGALAALVAAPEDLALIQFSSGTTRSPRPVALSHAAVTAQCAALRPLIFAGSGAPQRGVSWLPLYHDMGLIGALLSAVTFPGPLVLIPPERFLARPAIWLQTIARHRATISPAPAFAFALCTRRVSDEQMAGCDLSSWRLALCGAEPIRPGILADFAARFAPYGFRARALAPAYGLAESALAVTCTPPGEGWTELEVDASHLGEHDRVQPGSHTLVAAGVPVAGVEVNIRDGASGALPERRIGRIHVRGPMLMSGYFGQAEATAEVMRDGWLDTGDLGFLAEGRLYIAGRAKDVIIIRGANRLHDEFEDCLVGLSGLRPGRSIAVGYLPADDAGESLLLLVELARDSAGNDHRELVTAIRRRVRLRTGIEPHAVELLAPGTLPRTSSGKLRRQEALRRYLAGELAPPGRTDLVGLAGHLLRSAVGFARARWRS